MAATAAPTAPAAPPPRPLFLKSIQGGAIRTLIEVLKEIVHDVSLRFDATGMRLLTMDGAKCALVYLKLHAESFEEYSCSGTFDIGINMASLFKLIRTTNSHDTISMYMDANANNELGITIQNAEKNSITDFKLKLLDVDHDEIVIPSVDFDQVITMPSAYFQRLCRDMLNISDTMTISTQGGQLVLGCNGDFARQETVLGEADAGMSVSMRSDKKIEGRFSLKYLSLFCKAANACNTIELFLKESFPLIMRYTIASLGELKFCLAPKVD